MTGGAALNSSGGAVLDNTMEPTDVSSTNYAYVAEGAEEY